MYEFMISTFQLCMIITAISITLLFASWCIDMTIEAFLKIHLMFHVKHQEHKTKSIDEELEEDMRNLFFPKGEKEP